MRDLLIATRDAVAVAIFIIAILAGADAVDVGAIFGA